ncbi:hypothetical protein [Phenylobacterium kunshanense]|uniref:Uncharacterized protein n=1 Tax=Phenylobacterium kunshanense TaxID=1445034 RepID=A0A328BLZ1_9CAUL|nr:hypothetical protein [Phenylobacterium kunshanense]RAK67451.1 hypothetical protein DJ019_05935 [Phenylobacterium kunshanense]
MLAIVAAVVALTPGLEARAADTSLRTFVAPPASLLRDAAPCQGAGRFQTGYEPALLFRDEDRDTARLRKLIEMPMGEMCLLGGSR